MSLSFNRVLLAGNLTRDPQVRFFANERAVADFGLAINRRFKGPDGQLKEEVTFIDVEAWGRTAELVGQYLIKGSSCFVEGRLRLDAWDDKKTGEKRTKIKVVAEAVQFTGSKPSSNTAADADGDPVADDQAPPSPRPSSRPPAARAPEPEDSSPPF